MASKHLRSHAATRGARAKRAAERTISPSPALQVTARFPFAGALGMVTRWRPRDAVMLLLMCGVGTALAVVIYILFDSNEKGMANQAFDTLLATQSVAFQSFFTTRVLTLRAVADALSAYPTPPNNVTTNRVRGAACNCGCGVLAKTGPACCCPGCPAALPDVYGVSCVFRVPPPSQILRPFTKILAGASGIGVLQRVDKTDIPAWQANQTAVWGVPITYNAFGFNGSANYSDVWLVLGTYSPTGRPGSVGLDVSAQPEVRESIEDMRFDTLNGSFATLPSSFPVPAFGNEVAITRLAKFFGSSFTSFYIQTTVYHGSMDYLVTVASIVDPFFNQAFTGATRTVIEIQDHTGFGYVRGTCDLGDAINLRTEAMDITTQARWYLSMGQCPSFRNHYITWKRWAFIAVIIVITLLAMELYRRVVKKSWMETEQVQDRAQKQTYSMIVGYVCHEVRNPLHVVKSSFEAVTSALAEAVAAGFQSRELPLADQQAVVSDGYNGLTQMQVRGMLCGAVVALVLLCCSAVLQEIELCRLCSRTAVHRGRCAGPASYDQWCVPTHARTSDAD